MHEKKRHPNFFYSFFFLFFFFFPKTPKNSKIFDKKFFKAESELWVHGKRDKKKEIFLKNPKQTHDLILKASKSQRKSLPSPTKINGEPVDGKLSILQVKFLAFLALLQNPRAWKLMGFPIKTSKAIPKAKKVIKKIALPPPPKKNTTPIIERKEDTLLPPSPKITQKKDFFIYEHIDYPKKKAKKAEKSKQSSTSFLIAYMAGCLTGGIATHFYTEQRAQEAEEYLPA